jgi:hypothetical protein
MLVNLLYDCGRGDAKAIRFWNMHNIINGKQMKDLEYYGDPNKYMVWNLQNIIKEKKYWETELSWATPTNISFKIFVILMGKK